MAHGKKRRGRGTRFWNKNRSSSGNPSENTLQRPLRLEPLEDRRMLAVLFVNNLLDLDAGGNVITGSLRNAINIANSNGEADTIYFRDFLFNGEGSATIVLDGRDNGGPFVISEQSPLEIVGPGPRILEIFAGGNNRHFLIDDGDEEFINPVSISGVTLSGGSPLGDDEDGRGGSILNREFLTLSEVVLQNNFAAGGGGAVYNDSGHLIVESSLIQNNTSLLGGGGIQNGERDQDDNVPSAEIINSTITGNTAVGIPDDDTPTGYGGGVLTMAGTVEIHQSTIVDNSASVAGGGVASLGFDPEVDEESGEPTVFFGAVTTSIRSSIIVGNTGVAGDPDDVAGVGMTDDDEMPVPYTPQIQSDGYNLFGVLVNTEGSMMNMDLVSPGSGDEDMVGVDLAGLFVEDPDTGEPILGNFGGILDVYMPNFATMSLAIDHGDPENAMGVNDQRGYQYVRVFDALDSGTARMDVGAAEVQIANFLVDTLVDEVDGRYVPYQDLRNLQQVTFNDFSLREAVENARANLLSGIPGVTTIGFDGSLTDETINADPTPGTVPPTILLTLGQLTLDIPLMIQGPSFELEIDALGNDVTPTSNNGDGSRVLQIVDQVVIDRLLIRGGDRQEFGGGILVTGDLTLTNSTIFDNFTTGNGGAIYVASGGTFLLDSSTVHGNKAASDGGAIYNAGGTVTVLNSTISGNEAQFRGGAIVTRGGDTTIAHSTITLNKATIGGGVVGFRNVPGTTTVQSSIVIENTGGDVHHVLTGTDIISSLGYNLVGTGNAVSAGIFSSTGDQAGVTPAQVNLAPLVKLGGPTPVHRLDTGSIAIDAGDPAAVAGDSGVPSNDQRGFPFSRVADGGGGEIIDIGAYEVHVNDLFVGDGSALEGSYATFIAALTDANLNPVDERIIFLDSYEGETLPGDLTISDSLVVVGLDSGYIRFRSSGQGSTGLTIDDGNPQTLIDVEFSRFRFEDNFHIESRENLTFTDNLFVNIGFGGNGGAISHQNGSLKISDSNFIGNSANGGGSGGAVYVNNGDLEINNTFLSGNTSGSGGGKGGAIFVRNGNFTANYLYLTGNSSASATGDGGAMYFRDAVVTLSNAVISGNTTAGSNADGAGIFAKNSAVTLNGASYLSFNNTFGSNSHGGAVFIDGGSFDVEDAIFFQNRTLGMLSSGGAIGALNAQVTISNTSINNNEARGANATGGGIYSVGGQLTIENSSIINNKTPGTSAKGGGIYSGGTLAAGNVTKVINSTISGNSATYTGGGIYNAGGTTEIRHATITNNQSQMNLGFGNGVGSFGDSATTLTKIYSSIVAGNGVSDIDRMGGNFSDTFQSLGYNLIGGGTSNAFGAGTNDSVGVLDPKLAPLSFDGTHAILDGSPAINGGDPTAVAGANGVPEFDQLGEARVKNGVIDIGAVESDLLPPLAGDFDGDGVVTGKDFLAWQRGESSAPQSPTDLADWQSNYGQSSIEPTFQAMVALDQRIAFAISAVQAESSRPVTASVVTTTDSVENVENTDTPSGEPVAQSPWWLDSDDGSTADVPSGTSEAADLQVVDFVVSSTRDFRHAPPRAAELSQRRGDFRFQPDPYSPSDEELAEDVVFEWIGSEGL